jgi:hypothetical protein
VLSKILRSKMLVLITHRIISTSMHGRIILVYHPLFVPKLDKNNIHKTCWFITRARKQELQPVRATKLFGKHSILLWNDDLSVDGSCTFDNTWMENFVTWYFPAIWEDKRQVIVVSVCLHKSSSFVYKHPGHSRHKLWKNKRTMNN